MDRDPFTDQGALLLAESDGCAVWQFHGRGGEGTMTVYQVLPGVMLSFNDFHMDCFESSFVPGRRMLAIDHCREGRMEDSPRGRPSGLYRGGGREAGPPAGPHRGLPLPFPSLPRADGDPRPGGSGSVPFPGLPGFSRLCRGAHRPLGPGARAPGPPRSGGAGAGVRRLLPGTGRHSHPLFPGQDPGAAALSQRPSHPGKGRGTALFLPLPGGDRQGHSGLSHPASVRNLHPGGAFPQVPHPP